MARFLKNQSESNGLAPGSFVFIGKQRMDVSRITVMDFNSETLQEKVIGNLKDLNSYIENENSTWINIDGIHDIDLIKECSKIFDIHPLHTEDILNTGQRPKIEDFDNGIFLTLKMLEFKEGTNIIRSEQVSFILKKNLLITFQEQSGDVFDPVRDRIRKMKGKIRILKADYLTYALIDTIIDNYLHITVILGDKIEELENQIIDNHSRSVVQMINTYKKEINYLNKVIRPVKEAVIKLNKLDNELLSDEIDFFLKDLLDLVYKTSDALDIYREMLSDFFDLYNSLMNNKTNDIFKFLTIFSTIFIPLTFIAGIYGTNFDYLPELHFKYSYFIMLSVMVLLASFMIYIFKKKKWF